MKKHHYEVGLSHARTYEAMKEADAERMQDLERRIREHGYCQYCRKKLSEPLMERTPGCCGAKACRQRRLRGE